MLHYLSKPSRKLFISCQSIYLSIYLSKYSRWFSEFLGYFLLAILSGSLLLFSILQHCSYLSQLIVFTPFLYRLSINEIFSINQIDSFVNIHRLSVLLFFVHSCSNIDLFFFFFFFFFTVLTILQQSLFATIFC
jgi:hypothetical protein